MSTRDFTPDEPEFYLGDPYPVLQRLRAEDPVPWYDAGQFWCVTRHADLQQVSRSPRVFSSAHGTQLFEIPMELAGRGFSSASEGQARSIIRMDPPEHNRHRKLVMPVFSPRSIADLELRIRRIARESIQAVEVGERVNFVEAIAVPTPMLVIAEMLGVPASDRGEFRRWSDAMIEAGGGGLSDETGRALGEFGAYLSEKLAECERSPREDLLSTLLHSEIDGERLSSAEILMFALTLLVAGNETVRNLISGGTHTLLQHPDQLRAVVEQPSRIPLAVEEMLRWISPVQTFVRRCMEDTELRGKTLREGQYVALLYGSANRDEEVFGHDSETFDISRESASRHVAFGFGEHYCMGASLARLEARIVFEELLSSLPDFEQAGPAERLPSVLMNSLVDLPVVFKR